MPTGITSSATSTIGDTSDSIHAHRAWHFWSGSFSFPGDHHAFQHGLERHHNSQHHRLDDRHHGLHRQLEHEHDDWHSEW